VSEQQTDRDRSAFGLLESIGGWDHVDEGPFGNSYWLVPSQAGESERYRVTSTSCTCLDFAYRGRSVGACKHVRALQAMLRVLRARTDS
jgi:predicted nucleic acid-binding Zn finger protein